MAIKIIFNSTDMGVIIQKREGEHNHLPKGETGPLNEDVKKEMRVLMAQKMTAAQIQNILRVCK
jgi:hypothetical protein